MHTCMHPSVCPPVLPEKWWGPMRWRRIACCTRFRLVYTMRSMSLNRGRTSSAADHTCSSGGAGREPGEEAGAGGRRASEMAAGWGRMGRPNQQVPADQRHSRSSVCNTQLRIVASGGDSGGHAPDLRGPSARTRPAAAAAAQPPGLLLEAAPPRPCCCHCCRLPGRRRWPTWSGWRCGPLPPPPPAGGRGRRPAAWRAMRGPS